MPKMELRLLATSSGVPSLPSEAGPVDAGAFGGGAVDPEDLGFDDDLALCLVDAVEEFLGLFDAVGGIDDDDGVGFRLEVDDAGAGAEDGFDEFLDLLDVGGAEVAELIVELGAGKLGELGLGEGVDGVALHVEGEAVHEGEFLHLLERIAVVEVAGDEVIRAGDLAVVEILAAGGLGEELEDVVEAGILDDVSLVGFLHFLFLLLQRTEGGSRRGGAGGGGFVRERRGAGRSAEEAGRKVPRRGRRSDRREDSWRARRTTGWRSSERRLDRFDERVRRILGVEHSGG